MFSSISPDAASASLRLDNYDCIGFDLDNTLCVYNICMSVEMEYNILSNYMVKEKDYDPEFLLQPLDEYAYDFLQKGLIIDFHRGNLLKIAADGTILKASHGTKLLSCKEIMECYGNAKKWDVASEVCKNPYEAYENHADTMRLIQDYFDVPASLAFARIIDSLDNKSMKTTTSYNVWPDVLAGLQYMYKKDNFKLNEDNFFQEIKSNTCKYIKKSNSALIDWLKKIKESGKITFLITGSNYDFASLISEVCLGKSWQDLFDISVFYARKPGFFNSCRPFFKFDDAEESTPISGQELQLGNKYCQGNWKEMYSLFTKTLKKEPKCLYFGDNLVQDVFTPSQNSKCHTVAIVEELLSENQSTCNSNSLLSSKFWGSYFFDEKLSLNTVWAEIIRKYSKMCIPSLSVLAQYSLNHEFKTFQTGPFDGYFPNQPMH